MLIDEEFINDFLKDDFTSTKRGRDYASLLLERKRNRAYAKEMIRNHSNSLFHLIQWR